VDWRLASFSGQVLENIAMAILFAPIWCGGFFSIGSAIKPFSHSEGFS
jgi:hypothetical protein